MQEPKENKALQIPVTAKEPPVWTCAACGAINSKAVKICNRCIRIAEEKAKQ